MISLRTMVTCAWAGKRIQRYLDADPSAPLSPQEIARLERHLAVCERCGQATAEHRALSRALTSMSARTAPDPSSVARLRAFVDDMAGDEETA